MLFMHILCHNDGDFFGQVGQVGVVQTSLLYPTIRNVLWVDKRVHPLFHMELGQGSLTIDARETH